MQEPVSFDAEFVTLITRRAPSNSVDIRSTRLTLIPTLNEMELKSLLSLVGCRVEVIFKYRPPLPPVDGTALRDRLKLT